MTGLDLAVDELAEVAVVITDYDPQPVDPRLSLVIKPAQPALDTMGGAVTTMHPASGLIEEIPPAMSRADAEFKVPEYIQRFVPSSGPAPLAGNTIGPDRMLPSTYM